jgi:hypothetical protein
LPISNHDCRENTCPFHGEHRNERDRNRSEFQKYIAGARCIAIERRARLASGQHWFSKMKLVEANDPKLAALIRKQEASIKEIDDYILSRTNPKEG